MEKEKTNKNQKIFRNQICTGVLSLIKEESKDSSIEGTVIDTSATRKIVALNIRKICFEDKKEYGEDLFYKVNRGEAYTYGLIIPSVPHEDVLKNNTLFIRDIKPIGAVLDYVGFSGHIGKRDLSEIKRIVMSNDDILRIKAHSVMLGVEGIKNINSNSIAHINEQASSLRNFRHMQLPTKPQEIEKVYHKHFK